MKVYKYSINTEPELTHQVPLNSKPLFAGIDPNGTFCIWVEVDETEVNEEKLTVSLYGTGDKFTKQENEIYLSTIKDDPFIWHVYYTQTS